jgi:hypothetical protein
MCMHITLFMKTCSISDRIEIARTLRTPDPEIPNKPMDIDPDGKLNHPCVVCKGWPRETNCNDKMPKRY